MGDQARRGFFQTGRQAGLIALGTVLLLLLAPASGCSAVPLEEVLHRSGRFAEQFWQWFPSVNCNETVLQAKLDQKGKVIYRQETVFDYLTLVEMNGDDLEVTESRQVRQQPGRRKNLPLLVTNGFSMMVLVFHPYYQNSFEFGQLPSERVEGRDLLRVHFRHVKGTRSPSALQMGSQYYPLDWEGTAWIDPNSWVIQRIEVGLMAPMGDVGLQALHCDVRYGPVRFSTSPETYWLPQVAEIEAQTTHQHWRNLHRFTDYRRFSTSVKIKTEQQP